MMGRIKNIFLHNLPIKIIAFLAACTLWMFVMNNEDPAMENAFSVPVSRINSPQETSITSSEESVRVLLRGPRSMFATVSRDEIRAVVDLEGLDEGEHEVAVQTSVPPGFSVKGVTPDRIKVTIDPVVQKRMPIQLVRTGTAPAGMMVAGIEPETQAATLVGPKSEVQRAASIIGYVSLPDTATGDMDLDVVLSAVDSGGNAVKRVRVVPKSISARVQFARGLSKKVVDIEPVFEGVLKGGYVLGGVTLDPARVEIAGDAAALDAVSSLVTNPISLSEMDKTTKLTSTLVLPQGVTVTNNVVTVEIVVK